jgi:hypothetical protein
MIDSGCVPSGDLAEWFEECLVSYSSRARLKWKRAQKRRAVELLIRSAPNRSDRSLAIETGFSRDLIAKIRKQYPPTQYRTGRDGKRYRHAHHLRAGDIPTAEEPNPQRSLLA